MIIKDKRILHISDHTVDFQQRRPLQPSSSKELVIKEPIATHPSPLLVSRSLAPSPSLAHRALVPSPTTMSPTLRRLNTLRRLSRASSWKLSKLSSKFR